MPTQPFHIVDMQNDKSLQEQVEYLTNELAKTQKTLRYLLSNGNLDTENIRELNADVVNAGTLNANLVKILGALGDKFFQIDENGIQANNGLQDVLNFDLNTGNLSIAGIITALAGMIGGWTIQDNALYSSTTSYPRVVLDPVNNEIAYYFEVNNYIKIKQAEIGDTVDIQFVRGGRTTSIGQSLTEFVIGSVFGQDIQISAGGNLKLFSNSGNVQFQSWSKLLNNFNQSLQSILDGKLDKSGGLTITVPVDDGEGNVSILNFVNGQLVFII